MARIEAKENKPEVIADKLSEYVVQMKDAYFKFLDTNGKRPLTKQQVMKLLPSIEDFAIRNDYTTRTIERKENKQIDAIWDDEKLTDEEKQEEEFCRTIKGEKDKLFLLRKLMLQNLAAVGLIDKTIAIFLMKQPCIGMKDHYDITEQGDFNMSFKFDYGMAIEDLIGGEEDANDQEYAPIEG